MTTKKVYPIFTPFAIGLPEPNIVLQGHIVPQRVSIRKVMDDLIKLSFQSDKALQNQMNNN